MKKITAFLLLFCLSCTMLQAQKKNTLSRSGPLVIGLADTLQSAVLGEARAINIYLPDGYSPDSAATYPVVYLLDGAMDEDFLHMAGLVQFESFPWVNRLKPSILVGIGNTDRKRDMTYKAAPDFKMPDFAKVSPEVFSRMGGSEKFITFIEKELQPYIAKKYKTNGHRTLIGQSLAGLLVSEILLKKSALFDDYIIVSPSLWWDNESLLKNAPELLLKQPDKAMKIYIATGKEGKTMEEDARRLAKILRQSGRKNTQVFFEYLPDEDHGTILHTAADRAFRLFIKPKAKTGK